MPSPSTIGRSIASRAIWTRSVRVEAPPAPTESRPATRLYPVTGSGSALAGARELSDRGRRVRRRRPAARPGDRTRQSPAEDDRDAGRDDDDDRERAEGDDRSGQAPQRRPDGRSCARPRSNPPRVTVEVAAAAGSGQDRAGARPISDAETNRRKMIAAAARKAKSGEIGAIGLEVVLEVRATPGNVEVLGSDTASMNAAAESFLSPSWWSSSSSSSWWCFGRSLTYTTADALIPSTVAVITRFRRARVLDEDLRLAVLVRVVAGRLSLSWVDGDEVIAKSTVRCLMGWPFWSRTVATTL